LKLVLAAVAAAPAAELAAKVEAGTPFTVGEFDLDPGDLLVQDKAPEGWAGVVDRGTQLLLDVRITPELAREGMAREVVRHVQEARKEAGLEIEDRIALYLATDSPNLREAIENHRDYIAGETLTLRWGSG